MFALMTFIYLQTIPNNKNRAIPYAITIANDDALYNKLHHTFRPEITISKRIYSDHGLDRMSILSAPPFCDIADELIDHFEDKQLIFSDAEQFKLLKSQFKVIGYNFDLKPICLWHKKDGKYPEDIQSHFKNLRKASSDSFILAEAYIETMANYLNNKVKIKDKIVIEKSIPSYHDLSKYKIASGVYFFRNSENEVVYVGKAKNIRKRLQSHFSNRETGSYVNYSEVHQITVEYTGNEIIAQLIETENIKFLKPIYNIQQISDSAPYIINQGKTAKGILRLKITRKDVADNMPEKYFNRDSVKQALTKFCLEYDLCRKYCGLESAKGPCSIFTIEGRDCVCSGGESIEEYNKRFSIAFNQFKRKKSRKIFKLTGRNQNEDAFIYLVNGIYEGYGFIPKDEPVTTVNDILGYLNIQNNNYETSRILNNLSKKVSPENIFKID